MQSDHGTNNSVTIFNPTGTEEISEGKNAELVASVMESVKGYLISAGKLLEQLETTKKDSEIQSKKVCSLTKELEYQATENINLKERLSKEITAIEKLEEEVAQLGGSNSTCDSIQNDINVALEQTNHADRQINSCEIYIKQLEAQKDVLNGKLKALIAAPKMNKRRMQAFEKREQQIKELQQALNKANDKKVSSEYDRMEMNITYELLQRDHNELKETLAKQQLEHHTTLTVQARQRRATHKEIEQQHMSMNMDASTKTLSTLEDMRRKLRDNKNDIERLQNEIESLNQSANPSQSNLITAFKTSLVKNEILKQEKRVLQDKLTEQWMIDHDRKRTRRNSILNRHGFF